jgi:hypothetical protein
MKEEWVQPLPFRGWDLGVFLCLNKGYLSDLEILCFLREFGHVFTKTLKGT